MNQTLASNYRSEALAVGAGDTRCCFKHREKRFVVCVCVPPCACALSDNTSMCVQASMRFAHIGEEASAK